MAGDGEVEDDEEAEWDEDGGGVACIVDGKG